jgi:hypothetical protein
MRRNLNYLIFFLLLFCSSIMGGYALKDAFEFSVTIGYGLGILFLLAAVYFQSKRKEEENHYHN